jgi:hypothetical protein
MGAGLDDRNAPAGADRNRLDLDGATLEIADTRVVVDGKGEAGWRTISLDPVTVAYLRRHVAMLDAEREPFGDNYHDSGKLICHPDGRPVHPNTITDRFNRLVDRAGVKRIRLHDVRHPYATVSIDSGVDPKIVSDRIGHANMACTLTLYTHRSTGKDRAAAGEVAAVLFGSGWTCTGCRRGARFGLIPGPLVTVPVMPSSSYSHRGKNDKTPFGDSLPKGVCPVQRGSGVGI